jgi:hypothetical protein
MLLMYTSFGCVKKRRKVFFFLQCSIFGSHGRHGGSVVARLTVVLQSRVQIRRLPSPQLTANLLVGFHLGWHLAVS